MRNESFYCEQCGKFVPPHPQGSARNHCPFCLYSKHVDENFPGDRKSFCNGLMAPTGITYKKNKGWMIEHSCIRCKKKHINKLAPDDNFLEFIQNMHSIFET